MAKLDAWPAPSCRFTLEQIAVAGDGSVAFLGPFSGRMVFHGLTVEAPDDEPPDHRDARGALRVNAVVGRIDATGRPRWLRTLHAHVGDEARQLAVLPGGDVVVAGLHDGARSAGGAQEEAHLAVLARDDGRELLARALTLPDARGAERAAATLEPVVVAEGGRVCVAGRRRPPAAGPHDATEGEAFLACLQDVAGPVLWHKPLVVSRLQPVRGGLAGMIATGDERSRRLRVLRLGLDGAVEREYAVDLRNDREGTFGGYDAGFDADGGVFLYALGATSINGRPLRASPEGWESLAHFDGGGRLRWAATLDRRTGVQSTLDPAFDASGRPCATVSAAPRSICGVRLPPSYEGRDGLHGYAALVSFAREGGALTDIWHVPMPPVRGFVWHAGDLIVHRGDGGIARLRYD